MTEVSLTPHELRVFQALKDGQWRTGRELDDQLNVTGSTDLLMRLEVLGLVEWRNVETVATSRASYRKWRVKS